MKYTMVSTIYAAKWMTTDKHWKTHQGSGTNLYRVLPTQTWKYIVLAACTQMIQNNALTAFLSYYLTLS